jgi:hypothetical protein
MPIKYKNNICHICCALSWQQTNVIRFESVGNRLQRCVLSCYLWCQQSIGPASNQLILPCDDDDVLCVCVSAGSHSRKRVGDLLQCIHRSSTSRARFDRAESVG